MNSNLKHNEILRVIDTEIHSDSPDFKMLKAAAQVYLNRAFLHGCSSGYDMCCELEKIGLVKLGDYTVIKQILKVLTFFLIINKIEKKEKELEVILQEEAHMSIDCKMEQEPTWSLTGLSENDSLMDPAQCSFKSFPSVLQQKLFKIIHSSDALKDWRMLGRELEINDADLDAIAHDHPQLKEQCYQMLKFWAQKKGERATPNSLSAALKELEYTQVSESLLDALPAH